MGNTFGNIFRVTTWGESHGRAIGVVIDGCPALLPIEVGEIEGELARRRPGQSGISSAREEADKVEILSGVFEGRTLGSPISMIIWNQDIKKGDYDEMKDKYRPSHADYTYEKKYRIRDVSGGGRASARETVGRVAAGVIAKKILEHVNNIEICSYVESVGNVECPELEGFPKSEDVEQFVTRCPNTETNKKMEMAILKAKEEGDSLGGVIKCRVRNMPVGLGSPVFDRLEADLAKAMLSIPATKGFEVGSGFEGTKLKGSEHNDIFEESDGEVKTLTNNSGGVQGGISNGEEVYFRVAFKPTSTILKKQRTIDKEGKNTEIEGKGRHDPCVLPRAVPIVEAMTALVLVDHWLRHCGQNQVFSA